MRAKAERNSIRTINEQQYHKPSPCLCAWVLSEVNGVLPFIGKSQQSSEWEWESHKHMRTELQTGMPRALEHLLESRQEASMQGNSPCGTTQWKSDGIMEEAWWKPIKHQKLVSPLCLSWISIFKLFNPYHKGMKHLSRRLISHRWPLPLISYWELLGNHCTSSSSLFCRMKWEAAVATVAALGNWSRTKKIKINFNILPDWKKN